MLVGDDMLQFQEIKKASIRDYLNKFSRFVDRIESDNKIAEAKARQAKRR